MSDPNKRYGPTAPDTPLPSPQALKPTNTQTGSLYHTCRSVLDRLTAVDGMTEYLESVVSEEQLDNCDPLSKLTLICRRGFPLCKLYNALNPVKKLSEDKVPKLTMTNSCKANVYHFIVACRNDLHFPEEDMFTISDLYQDDTNGFVKVVNTVNKLLQLLEDRGLITVRSSNRNSDPNAPKNTRDKVVLELLETERKFVQDMETLQNYMRELQIQKIVSPDTIHYLFGNLNALVDFQRRFLVHLEETAEKLPEQQRIGHLFIQMEESFSVYEPYCANYYSAQDLVVQETPRLSKLADVLDPVYQLPSLLIKPVQRICKYPLLVNELVKSTDKNWAYSQELMDGLAAIKRVAEKVNETRRQFENLQAVEELKKRLDDGKELAWKDYGSLMLQDKVPVSIDDDNERDLHVFLFENVLLFCKEPKSSTILPKSNTLSINKKKRRGSLVPKFNIQTNLIADAAGHSQDGIWNLKIDIDHREMRQLSLKLRNEEQVKMWQSGLIKAKNLANETLTLSGSTLIADDDEDFCDDEEDVYFDIRSRRSNSFANHLPGRAKMTPSQSTDTIGWKHNSNGRPFQTVPGMNLSPLPRSSNSSVTSTNNYGYYPVSPPPSHPSSPTTHAMRTSNSNSSNWHRHDSKNGFNDLATKLLSDDEYLSYNVGRSHSHSAAVDIATKINPNRPFIPTPNRLRSQSNPNNMRNGIDYTTLTSSSAMLTAPKIQKPKPLDLSRGPPTPPSIRPVNSSPRLKDPPTTPGCVKVKLNFSDGIYVIVAPQDVSFFELMDRVEKKIRLVSNLNPGDLLRLKYQDEDSDLITINSDDDVQMAFESRGAYSTVNLFVSV